MNNNFLEPKGVLNGDEIIEYRKRKEIVIEPFNLSLVNPSSYNVRLGDYYYRERIFEKQGEPETYNPYSPANETFNKAWAGPFKAEKSDEYLNGVHPDEKVIWLYPKENILAHTIEFIGGVDKFATVLSTRSSIGRNFIETCKCSFWGGSGYFNRWTFEITNNSNFKIPIIVGREIAQIVFIPINQIQHKEFYNIKGKYQSSNNINEIMKEWKPEDMLPKLYNDFKK